MGQGSFPQPNAPRRIGQAPAEPDEQGEVRAVPGTARDVMFLLQDLLDFEM